MEGGLYAVQIEEMKQKINVASCVVLPRNLDCIVSVTVDITSLTCRTGPRRGPHAKWAHYQKRFGADQRPRVTRQKPSLPRRTKVPPTFFATQPPHWPSTTLALLGLCVAPVKDDKKLAATVLQRAWPAPGNFKDVRFLPLLNFYLVAALLMMFRFTLSTIFGQFWAPPRSPL